MKSFNDVQVFFGTVKSFNEEKGWGHISCPQTQQIYGKDMFVMRSAIANGGTIRQDDMVSFSVQAGQKGPEATNVRVMAQSYGQTFNGAIKQYDEEKGWGFIQCDETRQLYAKDIFIHKNELGGYVPQAGEFVQFAVQISKEGRPEATQMSFGQGGYAATRRAHWSSRTEPF